MNQQQAIERIKKCLATKAPELYLRGFGLTDTDFVEGSKLRYWLGQCKHLKSLDLSYNRLREIKGLDTLTDLKKLYLNNNELREIKGLAILTDLKELYLNNNQLREIKGLVTLTGLRKLWLFSNQLREIKGLATLTGLTTLNLSGNQLSEIKGLETLTGLTTLDLSGNQLKEIKGLENLINLAFLNLSDTQLREIKKLVDFPNLRSLDISKNNIQNLYPLEPLLTREIRPLGLALNKNGVQLEKDKINVWSNPLIIPPKGVLKNGEEAVLRYLKKLKQEGTAYIHEAKLILVGDGGTGKTSLQWRLQSETAKLPMHDGRTRGIDIAHWNFKTEGDQQHIAHIWDFGGQDVYYPVHRFFLTENAVFVLLASTRIAHHNFAYWIPTIFQFGGKSPIILGQTCHDGNKETWTDLGYYVASEHFNIIKTGQLPYHELNLLNNNEGLAGIRSAISQQLSALPHYGKAVPNSWLAVREAVAKKGKEKACISYQQFTELCRHTNPTSFAELIAVEDCAKFLHSIGVILWYSEMEGLKDWVVLQPEWAMNAVYQIIDDAAIQNRRGMIQSVDFERLWQDNCYQNLHSVLKQMLQVFKIAFPQKHRPQDYIMPARLLFMPVEQRWPVGQPWLRLTYQYEFMPRGMVNQLSAELSRCIIADDQVWNDAVNLEYEKARCQVREEFHKGKIYIKATGSDARALVVLVMNALRDITDSYRGVTPQIFVPCTCAACSQLAEPTTFLYDKLLDWETKRQNATVTCNESGEQLPIDALLRNVGLSNSFKGTHGGGRKKLFISYSKHDEEFKEEFHSHLVTLREQGLAYDFNCKQIDLGAEWDPAIQQEIDDCDMMICLVSKGFLNTSYIRNNEVKVALEKGKQVIPVIIKPCDWENSNIGQLYAPLRGKPVSLNHEKLLRNIIEETTPIERDAHWNNIIKELREKVFKA